MGTSIADPTLQKDAVTNVFIAAIANSNNKPCKDLVISNTEYIKHQDKKWEEVWTVRNCGSHIPVQLLFTPDGKGGTYFMAKKIES